MEWMEKWFAKLLLSCVTLWDYLVMTTLMTLHILVHYGSTPPQMLLLPCEVGWTTIVWLIKGVNIKF